MKSESDKTPGFARWYVPAALLLLSIPLFFLSAVDFVPPGEIAQLEAQWLGFDVSSLKIFPLMGNFAKLVGLTNAISPVCATISVLCLYYLVSSFIGMSITGDFSPSVKKQTAEIGGACAALVYMFSTALSSSAMQLEPRLFDATWAIVSFTPVVAYSKRKGGLWGLVPLIMGVMAGVGSADTAMFMLALPLYAGVVWSASVRRGGKGYGAAALTIIGFTAAFFAYSIFAVGDVDKYWDAQVLLAKRFGNLEHWYAVIIFAVLPFIVTLFSSKRAFSNSTDKSERFFHALLTILLILATSTSLAPDAIIRPLNMPALFSTLCAAFASGCVLAFWWSQAHSAAISMESATKEEIEKDKKIRICTGYSAGGFFAFVLVISSLVNRFVMFDSSKAGGAFVDKVCERIVADMDGRTWFVSDGSFDDNLMLAARRAGKKINIVNLRRENDVEYIDRLAETVEAENLCPAANSELLDILRKYRGLERRRLVPFLQKWFSSDPEIASKAVVFGAPDIWLYANKEPVAEFMFFGGDPSKAYDWGQWKQFSEILHAPKGWGSWSLYGPGGASTDDMFAILRLSLRRHMGLIANNTGYAFQEQGIKLQTAGDEEGAMAMYDKAFDMYELVLNEIDADNFCALVNEMHLARSRHKRANARLKDLSNKLSAIYKDEKRRFRPSDLTLLYGYICDPEYLARYGYALLKSGRSEDAMMQFRRALDFIPEENRALAELSLAASYYESRQNEDKAREAYNSTLKIDSSNKIALLGLARLSLMENDTAKAKEYLNRLPAELAGEPDVKLQFALIKALEGDLPGAKTMLRQLTDANSQFMQAWSLLASIVMQQIDAVGDTAGDSTKAALKESLETELEIDIIPSMEKNATSPDDYNLLSTKAFSLMRKGGRDNLMLARDSLIAASKSRPDIRKTSEFILDLDIKMNDVEDARRQAVKELSVNPAAPLANYVLGSIALREDNPEEAEKYLRLAVAGKQPAAMALNDLAETLKRRGKLDEAEKFARKATEAAPSLYVVWETLGTILMDAGKDFDEAEACIQKACDLSKDEEGKPADVRMLISLARVQMRRGQQLRAKGTLRSVLGRIDELSEFEKRQLEELRKSAK